MGVASPDAYTLYTALAAAENDAGNFDITHCLKELIACSDGFCTTVLTEMASSNKAFDIGLYSSTAYATGVTITATLPADPSTIAASWVSISVKPYAFNKWWNPSDS